MDEPSERRRADESNGRIETLEAKIESHAQHSERLESRLERVFSDLAASIKELRTEIQEARRPNWSALGVGVAAVALFQVAIMGFLGFYANTTSEGAKSYTDSKVGALEESVNGLIRLVESRERSEREFREGQEKEWTRMRADDDRIRDIVVDGFNTLRERTRYEQGKTEMDRQWRAEWRRHIESGIRRLENRNE